MSVLVADEVKIQRAARLLWEAAATRRPIDPVRHELGSECTAVGYAVQELLTLRRIGDGARVVGRKIGLTSPAVQQQLGVDQPDFGVLFDDMAKSETDCIDVKTLIEPKIEAEVAFVLDADLDDADLTVDVVRRKISHALPALEIVDSRVRNWDISIVDTVADNASSALYVLGTPQTDITDLALDAVTMELTADGYPVSSGNGSACLGDPLNAILWLAKTCQKLELPLRAGELVLSGALGAMVPISPGSEYHAVISKIGSVTARFGEENQS